MERDLFSTSADERTSEELDIEALLRGRVPRFHSSLRYRISLTLVALVMATLPLVYLAMIAGIGYGLYGYTIYGLNLLEKLSRDGKGGVIAFLMIMAPVVAGLFIMFFLVKPLLARPRRAIPPRTLKSGDEPELFKFVTALCRAVGAPVPCRIQVDCEVNAAAGPNAGLGSLMRRDLRLVIGMPLVAGMTLRQFAGVLAHELGHFSQEGGLLTRYFIETVNHWFARVVYERDAWAVFLEVTRRGLCRTRQVSGANILVALFQLNAVLTQPFIWFSRRLLWLLMRIGHTFQRVPDAPDGTGCRPGRNPGDRMQGLCRNPQAYQPARPGLGKNRRRSVPGPPRSTASATTCPG